MSARFFQSSTPQENQTIKCNDLTVRGAVVANESIAVAKGISLNGELSFEPNTDGAISGKIQLPALENFTQPTATNANVAASTGGVAPQQFRISTFESAPGVGGDLAAGASVSFDVFHSGIVAGKTIILVSKAGSYNGNTKVSAFIGAAANNEFTVTRHNFGATTASGTEQLLFKLIQSV